ncbi:MAG: nucleotidyltransferase family protein [Chloroflexota bacterium]
MAVQIAIDDQDVGNFCQRHHIRKLALFGSALRQDFRPVSDVDVLVWFDPQHIPGFIRLAGMEIELSRIVGRKVDMRTPEDLSRYYRQDVIDSAKTIYVSG